MSSGEPPPAGIYITARVSDDATVRAFTPDTNYGRDPLLAAVIKDPDSQIALYPDMFYLKFTVTGLNGPAKRAWVKLFVMDGSTQTGGRIHEVSLVWDESTITWNSSGASRVMSSPVIDWRGQVTGGTWTTFDVTPAITGNGTYTFVVDSLNSAGVTYASKENPTRKGPELIVQP